jgi:hypothetical protein
LLLVAQLAAACDDDGGSSSSTATSPAGSPTAAATAAPERTLAEQIGVRGDLPANDPIDLAARYGRTQGRASASKPFAGEPNVGDARPFFVQRISGAAFSGKVPPDNVTIAATLLAKSEHAYFYVDDALEVDQSSAQEAADDFEASVWPAVTGVFGTPASPGVDGDPRIIILQADLGGAVGGYFSPDDGFLRSVRPLSNEAEMLYMDRTLRLGGSAFSVVLAHELQHLIHANVDANEEAWINEGISEASSGLVGGALSSVSAFAGQPDIQLNAWGSEDSSAHYGAGAAFARYLAHRFGGDQQLGAIIHEQGDGAQGIDEFLATVAPELTFRDVFADWITANALDRVEGPYSNPGEPIDVRVEDTLSPDEPVDGEGTQFGTNYYLLDALDPGQYTLQFDGAADVNVLPVDAPDGGSMLWSNGEDDVDTTLTREIDLTDAAAPVVTFQTWFDIESWYDWGYVSVSADGGATWTSLAGDQTTTDDPVQVALGVGYTGKSGGGETPVWVDESISLHAYAGQKVLLRFEYVTDGSTHGEGWAIDDVAIDDIGFSDPDNSDQSWTTDGWVRIDAPLPQSWIVRLIAERDDGEPVVIDADVAPGGTGSMEFDATGLHDVVLAVAGATEGTHQRSPYTLTLSRR